MAGIKRVVSVCVGEKHSLALQRIARPPRETILTLADEEDDAGRVRRKLRRRLG